MDRVKELDRTRHYWKGVIFGLKLALKYPEKVNEYLDTAMKTKEQCDRDYMRIK